MILLLVEGLSSLLRRQRWHGDTGRCIGSGDGCYQGFWGGSSGVRAAAMVSVCVCLCGVLCAKCRRSVAKCRRRYLCMYLADVAKYFGSCGLNN